MENEHSRMIKIGRPTKSERNMIYKTMLKAIIYKNPESSSQILCARLLLATSSICTIKEFPELEKHRPIGITDSEIWFPLNIDGFMKRIQIIHQAIIETEC